MEWMRRQDHRLGSVYKMKEDQEYTEESRGSLSGEIERSRSLYSQEHTEESRGSLSGEIERSRSLYTQEYTEESRGSLSGEIERSTSLESEPVHGNFPLFWKAVFERSSFSVSP